MPDEQQAVEHDAAARAPDERRAEPVEPWLADDEATELPPRARRRLLTPPALALMAALAIASGFIAGVLVEKGQQSSSSPGTGSGASGLAARFAALRGGSDASSGAGTASTSSSGSGSTAGGATGGFGRLGGGAGATVGQVAYVSHGTLYVTTLEGNTVKVTAAPGATVSKSVTTHVARIHPGETVIVTGTSSANGAIAAQSIRAGAAGAGGGLGGAGAPFGGSSRSPSRSGASSGASGGGEQALFGKG